MIDIHSKYDNMHKNEIFDAIIYINNQIITIINCTLSNALAQTRMSKKMHEVPKGRMKIIIRNKFGYWLFDALR